MLGHYYTQQGAIDAGVLVCQNRLKLLGKLAELQIKGRNGQIQDARTYGDDPDEIPG